MKMEFKTKKRFHTEIKGGVISEVILFQITLPSKKFTFMSGKFKFSVHDCNFSPLVGKSKYFLKSSNLYLYSTCYTFDNPSSICWASFVNYK